MLTLNINLHLVERQLELSTYNSTDRKRIIIRTFYNPIISMLDFKELFSIPTEVHFQRFSNSKDTYLIRASKDIQYGIVRPDNSDF